MSLDGILIAYMMVKIADLSQTVFMQFTNEAYKWMNTRTYVQTHTHTLQTLTYSDECHRHEFNEMHAA